MTYNQPSSDMPFSGRDSAPRADGGWTSSYFYNLRTSDPDCEILSMEVSTTSDLLYVKFVPGNRSPSPSPPPTGFDFKSYPFFADMFSSAPTDKEKEEYDRICKCVMETIKKKPLRKHLEDIFFSRIKCDRHSRFMTLKGAQKDIFYSDAGVGPFDDNLGFEFMMELEGLLESIATEEVIDQLGCTPYTYLLNVWFYEAVMFTMMNVMNYSAEDAKKIFDVSSDRYFD